jgi:hypothetical protein
MMFRMARPVPWERNSAPSRCPKHSDTRARWGAFRKHFRDEWFPLHAEEYFRQRDVAALPYLPRVLARPASLAAIRANLSGRRSQAAH